METTAKAVKAIKVKEKKATELLIGEISVHLNFKRSKLKHLSEFTASEN